MRGASLRLKLVAAFVLVAGLVAAASLYTIFGLNQTKDLLTNIIDNDTKRIQTLQKIQLLTNDALRNSSLLLQGLTLPENVQAVGAGQYFNDATNELAQLLATYRALEGDAITSELHESFEQIANNAEALLQTAATESTRQLSAAQRTALAQRLSDDGSDLNESIEQGLAQEEAGVLQEYEEVDDTVSQIALAAAIATGGAVVIAVLLGVLTASSISRRVMRIKIIADNIRSGNLSKSVEDTSGDELGGVARSFNEMTRSLRDSYARLAFEKERDETLLESMSEGMIALDATGKIVLINNVALHLFELESKNPVVGSGFTELITLYDQAGAPLPATKLPTTTTLQNGEVVNEVFAYKTDDRKILINIASGPIKLEGNVAGAILVLRDVTKEKEVDRMKTEFISLASHQLRTPLSAIKWFSEMLLNGDAGELSPDQKDFTKNISDSTDRMVDLVNSLLNISRIESGRIIIDPRPTDLKELITGIVNDLKAKTEERQQNLIISVHPDMPKLNIDPRLIGQVYLNLLTNAIKYTPKKGEISVFVSKKGEDVVSQVTDNGYGIPKDQQGRIFQKFFRAENVSKVETDGTGLGLYLIKAVVESSGGKIWFESEEGKGTSFWFTIPLSGMKAKEGEVTLDV